MHGKEVPQTDEEVQAAIAADYEGTNEVAIQGIYKCYRGLGNSVAVAWINTLTKVIEAVERDARQ